MTHPYQNKTVERAEEEILNKIKHEKIEKITFRILCLRLGESLPYETIEKAINSLVEKKKLCIVGKNDITEEIVYKTC